MSSAFWRGLRVRRTVVADHGPAGPQLREMTSKIGAVIGELLKFQPIPDEQERQQMIESDDPAKSSQGTSRSISRTASATCLMVHSVSSGWPVIDDNGRLALANGRGKKRDSCPRSGVITFADPSLKIVFRNRWMRITRAVTPRWGPRASLADRGCSTQAALCQPAKGRQQ